MRKRAFVLAAAAAAVLLPGPAAPQAWIGQVVGQQMAIARQAQLERDCAVGIGESEAARQAAMPITDQTFADYLQAVEAGDAKATAALFKKKKRAGLWSLDDVYVKPEAIRDPYAAPGRRIERLSFMIDTYGDETRALWKLSNPDAGVQDVWYIVRLSRAGKAWKLFQITMLKGPNAVEPDRETCFQAPMTALF